MFGLMWPVWRPLRHRRRGDVELRWLSARAYTMKWYPQGIDFGTWRGRRTLAVSWFRQDRAGQNLASRVTFIDLDRSRRLDVALAIEDDDGELAPAQIHAGGLAWFGDRLFVAATGQGIWEFDLSDTRRLRGAAARRVVGARRGFGAVSLTAVRTRVHPLPLRCSFLGRMFDASGISLPRVLVGEYGSDTDGRIGEFTIPDDADGTFELVDETSPQITQMQGAAQWGTRRFVSQSKGLQPGTLWDGDGADLKRSGVPLPIGCEDLALDPEERMLWSLGEHPWHRVVRGIPFGRLGL